MFADGNRLFLHRLVVNIVGGIAQQPGQRERHEDGGDNDGDDMQDDDA